MTSVSDVLQDDDLVTPSYGRRSTRKYHIHRQNSSVDSKYTRWALCGVEIGPRSRDVRVSALKEALGFYRDSFCKTCLKIKGNGGV